MIDFPYGSKHFLGRYLTPQIIPQTLPKKVLGSIGFWKRPDKLGNIWSPRDASDHAMAPFGGSIRVSGCPLAMTSQWSPRNLVMALFFGVPTSQLDAKLCQVVVKPAFSGGKYHFNQKTLNFYKFGQNWGAQKSSASKFSSISVMCFLGVSADVFVVKPRCFGQFGPRKPRFPGDFPLEHPSSNLNRVQLQIRLGGRTKPVIFMVVFEGISICLWWLNINWIELNFFGRRICEKQ